MKCRHNYSTRFNAVNYVNTRFSSVLELISYAMFNAVKDYNTSFNAAIDYNTMLKEAYDCSTSFNAGIGLISYTKLKQ